MQAAAQLQGIVGPQVYQSRFGPRYKTSFEASIGLLAGAIASIAVTWYLVAKRDRSKDDVVPGGDVGDEGHSSGESIGDVKE